MKSCLRRWSVSRVDNFWEVMGHILRSERNCPLVPPVAPTLWELTRELQLQGRLRKYIQFVKVFYTRLLGSKLPESCSFPRYQVKCILFPPSLVFVLKLVVAGIFRKNGRLKFKSLKSGALLSQGPQHSFIVDSHPCLCTVFLPTPVETFAYTRPHRVCHQHNGILSSAQDRPVGHGETLWFRLFKLKSPKIRLWWLHYIIHIFLWVSVQKLGGTTREMRGDCPLEPARSTGPGSLADCFQSDLALCLPLAYANLHFLLKLLV